VFIVILLAQEVKNGYPPVGDHRQRSVGGDPMPGRLVAVPPVDLGRGAGKSTLPSTRPPTSH